MTSLPEFLVRVRLDVVPALTLAPRRLIDAAKRASGQLEETLAGGVLLARPFPRIAPRHRSTRGQLWLADNTLIFNVLGVPATQVPMGFHAGAPIGIQVAAAAGEDHKTLAIALEFEQAFGGWTPPE